MPRTDMIGKQLDDAASLLEIRDFSGGLNSESNPRMLDPKECIDCENVKFGQLGKVVGRYGFVSFDDLFDADPDGDASFWDANDTHHRVIWYGGSMYDITTDAPVLVTAACYIAGNEIAWTELNNILYWSDGESLYGVNNVGLRQYDPTQVVPADVEKPVDYAPGAGLIAPPCAKVLTTYAGSIVAANTTVVAFREPHAVRWSNVNDPTTWQGTNIFEVAQGRGGEINACVPFGISTGAIDPYQALFIGKSKRGVYQLRGSLDPSSLSEILINAPPGVRDGQSVRYVPGPDGNGYIIWLGTDLQFWMTNGAQSKSFSEEKIRTELFLHIQSVLQDNPDARFQSIVLEDEYQYVCHVGLNRWYVWDYDRNAWSRYSQWPGGYLCNGFDSNGLPACYVADAVNRRWVQLNTGTDDDGQPIASYWASTWLDCGDPAGDKIWKDIFLDFATDSAVIEYAVVPNLGEGVAARGFFDPADSSNPGSALTWDEGFWDEDPWGSQSAQVLSFQRFKRRDKLGVQSNRWNGKDKLRGYDVQIVLSNTTSGAHFEVFAVQCTFIRDGRVRVA